MKPTVLAAAVLLCLPTIGNGRDLYEAAQDAQAEVASELSTCAAYYVLTAAMLDASDTSSDRDKSIAEMKKTAEVALRAATQISSAEVAAARMQLAQQTMQREMKNDWGNFSLVAVKYARPCKDIVERPDQRFAYWVKEKSKLPDAPPAKPK